VSDADIDKLRASESIEAEAWEDMFGAMPAPMADATGARVLRLADAILLVAPGIPNTQFNRAVGLGGTSPASARDVDAVVDAFDRAGAKAFLVHTSEATHERAATEALLRALGLVTFAARPTWAKCLRGTSAPPDAPTTLSLREVDHAEATRLAEVLIAAHEMPATMVPFAAALVGRPRWRAYAAYDGDEMVGGGVMYVSGARAWLGLGGTLSTHRGRGGQKAIMARRVADAIAAGVTAIATETGEPVNDEPNPSLANMKWCGFDVVGSRANWVGAASTSETIRPPAP
jgi:hypothetical protein